MKRLADGDLEVKIEGRERGDEIGDMVRSVTVFRDAAVENVRLEQDAAAAREALDRRVRAPRLRACPHCRRAAPGADRTQRHARQTCRGRPRAQHGRKPAGRLHRDGAHLQPGCRGAPVPRSPTCARPPKRSTAAPAISPLRRTILPVARNSRRQRSNRNSRALRHLSEIVRSTAESAKQTSVSVNETEDFAVRSGEVVSRAVDAMGEISRSSNKIATIIGVIDEIAFQTNLLALNAGVEAARAGEAGRGFAVVAQEVRELAQRCAGAAREIKGLISASSTQVSNGVHLVEETGTALTEIITHITDVRKLVSQISAATGEQSTGINEVTKAVQEVELITQRNAAMVEENNAEIHGLRRRVEMLSQKIERFKTRDPNINFHAGANERRGGFRRSDAA
ncbi:methyl-accepting chemotaxis protein [Neorhizobium galegae]|nr:methyl-accepting chemotaxis protein [Neorhizobium galegae]